jgi:hypothetical protein
MTHENAAQIGMRLQSGCEVHFIAYDRIVHPVLTAEIADCAIARIDADSQLKRFFRTGIAPFELEFALNSPPPADHRLWDLPLGVEFVAPGVATWPPQIRTTSAPFPEWYRGSGIGGRSCYASFIVCCCSSS